MYVEDATWDFSDAWFLAALGQFGLQGCALTELIGTADALNHAVPTVDEAAQSLGRPIASGLANAVDGRFSATPEGLALYEKRRGGMFELTPSLLVQLRRVELIDGRCQFEPGEYNAAFDTYRMRVAKYLA